MLVLTLLVVFVYVSGFLNQAIPSALRDDTASPETGTGCGDDRLPSGAAVYTDYDKLQVIENFPWFGVLIHPFGAENATTTRVVLITHEIALSSALDIDSIPKEHFRALSRVVLGHSCVGPYIRVRDYALHPEYGHGTFSTLAMLQLETKKMKLKISPICTPPEHFPYHDQVYALTMTDDCRNSTVMLHRMKHVELSSCCAFYHKAGLNIGTIWPTHPVCAQAVDGQHCIWRSGSVLVIRHEGRWRLLGIGINGPGCRSPSRFLDYGMYHEWVKHRIARIGQPTITRMGPDHLILRRTTKNIPRYGPCDPEESRFKTFSYQITMVPANLPYPDDADIGYHNVTLLANVDYHCIVLQVWNEWAPTSRPTIFIRHKCRGRSRTCRKPADRNVYYYVVIKFSEICTFKMAIYYGTQVDKGTVDNATIHSQLVT